MLTSRAWWLLSLVLLLLTIGVTADIAVLGLTALALLLWLIWEGLLFAFRVRVVARGLTVYRQVRDDRGPVTTLWAGRTFQVRVEVRLSGGQGLPYLAFEEPLPFGLDLASGAPKDEGAIAAGAPLRLTYAVRAAHPGRVRFEGVRIQLADLHGLFYHVTFLRREATFRVLPPLVNAEGKTPAAKRHNLLPPPGINRLPRPGSGSELLDLRDYLPGDPPKTIAWKVSARRDRLITKEYESEVPLRCTLFVDTSNAVRLGPPGRNALARLVEIGSAVAQANMTARDLTGLCLFDEEGVKLIKPARTRRHLVQLFNQLADAAGLAPASGTVDVDALLPLAYSFAREVYPEQLDQGVNGMPFWLPLFHPVPGPWARRTTPGARLWRWLTLPLATVVYALIGLNLLGEVDNLFSRGLSAETKEDIRIAVLSLFGSEARFDPEELNQLLSAYGDALTMTLLVVLCLAYPFWIILIRDVVPQLFAARKRRLMRSRKKLAALFARRYDLGPGGLELLMQDDDGFGRFLERFLNDHNIPHTPALFDRRGRFLYSSPQKVEVLAAALLRAVGKGHDNELFVLLVDLVELEGRMEPLLRAVKVALARHHQVVVVCPWPPDLALPDGAPADDDLPGLRLPGRKKKGRTRGVARPILSAADLRKLMARLTSRCYNRSFHRLRKTFARLQVPVVCAAAEEPVRLILERLDRLRGVRRRR